MDEVVAAGLAKPIDGMKAAGQTDAAAFAVLATIGYAAATDLRAADRNRGLNEWTVVDGSGMRSVNMPIQRALLDEQPLFVGGGGENGLVAVLLARRARFARLSPNCVGLG